MGKNHGSENHGGAPIGYMERTRLYYRALGYDQDYVWAHFEEVPFAPLARPLSEARITLVTTSLPGELNASDAPAFGGKEVWSRDMDALPERMHTDHLAWDRGSTHTDDRESFLPIDAMRRLAADGLFGELTRRAHGAPTVYSQSRATERDAPEIRRRVVEDGADAVLLAPL